MDVCDSDPDSFKSSLECGNIAVPRDLFPYLIISENRKYHLTPEQRSNLKYLPVSYDKDNDECFINIKFKDIQKFIPYKIFKKVWDENNAFCSERQLNNSDFFQFFKNTIKQENIIDQQDDQGKLAALYDLSVKMIFDMLVYTYHSESIVEVADILRKVLVLSDEAIVKFADYILIDNASEFIRILFKCSEGTVRDNVSNILSTAINRMFSRVDLIEKAEKFMHLMFGAIQTQASSNWTKFEHFFNMIKQVAIGGEPQLEFMKKNQIETLLADFFLAEKSPLRPKDEIRMCMGNNYSKPTYDSLVQTICFLSRHTDPREEGHENQDLPPTVIGNRLFSPGENEKKVIVHRHFAAKAVKDAFEADAVGKLIAHWSYQNEANSIIFAQVFLRGINETDYEEVAPFLTAMHHFLSLKDDLQIKRLEWLLGTPMMMDGSMIKAAPTDKPKLGAYCISCMSDEVYYFPSTLDNIDSTNESILSLIWRSKRRFESYTMFCIKELLTLGEDIMRYIFSMPSPTYQYARYTDWIEQFCEEKSRSKSKSTDMYRDVIVQVQQILKKYNEDLIGYEVDLKNNHKQLYGLTDDEVEYLTDAEEEQKYVQNENESNAANTTNATDNILDVKAQDDEIIEFKSFPRPFVIGKVLNEHETQVSNTDNLKIVMSEVE